MNYYENAFFGENPEGQEGTYDEGTGNFQDQNSESNPEDKPDGDVPTDDSPYAAEGEDNEEGVKDEASQSDKPKRKRKKKGEQPSEDSQGDGDGEVTGDEGATADADSSFDIQAEPNSEGERQILPGDEGADADQSAGDLQEDTGAELEETDLSEDNEGADSDSGRPRAARRRQSSRPAILDASGNAIVQRSDTGQHDLSVLTAARNARRILTATVDGIETDGEALPRVIFYHGTVKVMIPFAQMGFDLDPEEVSQREARLLIDSMLGARIDYMVRGVDTEARIAGASRRDAMLLRRRTILNAQGTSNEFRINEGMRVMARVIHVARQVVRVEVFGFESYVRIDSISNVWVNDIREVIQVGEERPVEIISLQRDESGEVISMRVSMKAAEDMPQMELRDGNTYTGTISNFSDTAYYVRVNGIPVEVRCPIKSNHTMEMMNQGDYVKFYIRGIYEGVPTGAILKIIKKKLQPAF